MNNSEYGLYVAGIDPYLNNGYYTPDIEDFRVGYEYEFQGIPKGWHKMIFSEENSLKNMRYNIEKLKDAIRVPYLTKEQIEAEGWEEKEKNSYYISSDHGGYTLTLFSNHTIEIIDLFDCEKDYRGICPSINEFRYICKLLKI